MQVPLPAVFPLPNWGCLGCDLLKHFSTYLVSCFPAPVIKCTIALFYCHWKRGLPTCFGMRKAFMYWNCLFMMGCGKLITPAWLGCFYCGTVITVIFRRAVRQEACRVELGNLVKWTANYALDPLCIAWYGACPIQP